MAVEDPHLAGHKVHRKYHPTGQDIKKKKTHTPLKALMLNGCHLWLRWALSHWGVPKSGPGHGRGPLPCFPPFHLEDMRIQRSSSDHLNNLGHVKKAVLQTPQSRIGFGFEGSDRHFVLNLEVSEALRVHIQCVYCKMYNVILIELPCSEVPLKTTLPDISTLDFTIHGLRTRSFFFP